MIEHLMRGPHHRGIGLLPGEVAVFEQPSSAWPVAMLKQLDEVHLTGDMNSLNANATNIITSIATNATNIITSIQKFYRHPGRFINKWGKAVGVVGGGFSREMKKHFPQLVLGRLDYSQPDPKHSAGRQPPVPNPMAIGLVEAALHPPPPAQAPPLPPAQAPPLPAAPGPGQRPQAPPWGRWLDRDTNGCLNLQRIGESKQRPLELCSYEGLMALPPVGKEYQQGYKRVNDRLPKERVHPKTGKVCVPLAPEQADAFDPDTVPTVQQLLAELPPSTSGAHKVYGEWQNTRLAEAVQLFESHFLDQQRYKRVNDRLPKVKQRLHRVAEYRRGIDGRARNNA
ncbi:hypothetical protein QJQ45_001941 [Haematococcus lacustris]|nr:hypothetical protein QJQ45_001941 [Haematococcus lacustris]